MSKQKEMDLTKLIETYQSGDSLTDRQLEVLHKYFKDLYDTTKWLTPEFALFRKEIGRIYFSLDGFVESRKRK